MSDFETEVGLDIHVRDRALSNARSEIEEELDSFPVDIEPQTSSEMLAPDGGSSGGLASGSSDPIELGGDIGDELQVQTEILDDIEDAVSAGGGLDGVVSGGGGPLSLSSRIPAGALVRGAVPAGALITGTVAVNELVDISEGGDGIEFIKDEGEDFADNNPEAAGFVEDFFTENPVFDFGVEIDEEGFPDAIKTGLQDVEDETLENDQFREDFFTKNPAFDAGDAVGDAGRGVLDLFEDVKSSTLESDQFREDFFTKNPAFDAGDAVGDVGRTVLDLFASPFGDASDSPPPGEGPNALTPSSVTSPSALETDTRIGFDDVPGLSRSDVNTVLQPPSNSEDVEFGQSEGTDSGQSTTQFDRQRPINVENDIDVGGGEIGNIIAREIRDAIQGVSGDIQEVIRREIDSGTSGRTGFSR